MNEVKRSETSFVGELEISKRTVCGWSGICRLPLLLLLYKKMKKCTYSLTLLSIFFFGFPVTWSQTKGCPLLPVTSRDIYNWGGRWPITRLLLLQDRFLRTKFLHPGDIMYIQNPYPGDRPHHQIPMGTPVGYYICVWSVFHLIDLGL